MKKIILVLAGALVLASCQEVKKENAMLTERTDSLISALAQRNAELESALEAISEIQTGFDQINEAEGRITLKTDKELTATSKEKMKEDLAYIRQTMESNRQKIAELDQKLKNSNNKNSSLQKVVANLQNELADKTAQIAALQDELTKRDRRIAELGTAVEGLQANVQQLEQTNAAKEQQLTEQDAQLNRAWYVYGTARELKNEHILKDGQVLGEHDFNLDYFTPIDIRNDVEFPLYAKHAELMSVHPKGSWYTKVDENKEITFIINDPLQFWSVSRYMVIKVK